MNMSTNIFNMTTLDIIKAITILGLALIAFKFSSNLKVKSHKKKHN